MTSNPNASIRPEQHRLNAAEKYHSEQCPRKWHDNNYNRHQDAVTHNFSYDLPLIFGALFCGATVLPEEERYPWMYQEFTAIGA